MQTHTTQPHDGLAPASGSLTVERMADELGLDLCTFQGEGCDTCQEPKPDARIYVQMLQFAESNPEAGYYVCEHCLPEKHRVEKQREADCIEWAEAEAAAMMAEESGNAERSQKQGALDSATPPTSPP